MEQRFTFDQVARDYGAARPGYPDALVDDVIAYAGLDPSDAVLEVGCGSGQATKSFATRGFRMLALDPGEGLIRAAQESLAAFPQVEFVVSTFEGWSATSAVFRLLIAAQSWHWVPADVQFTKAAEALTADGTLAVFGHVPVGLPAPLLEDFKRIYLDRAGVWGPPPEAWYLPAGPFQSAFEASALFGPVTHKAYPWTWHHTTASYDSFLKTRSDLQTLSPTARQAVLDDIARAVDTYGGAFDMNYETHLYIARRHAAA
ncbi:MAG TPA: class I SAM-dependent methyltransferase [Vineibacter sp.]|nr:class I SAM-dependent methyltransferase [Vineibacter sp.]